MLALIHAQSDHPVRSFDRLKVSAMRQFARGRGRAREDGHVPCEDADLPSGTGTCTAGTVTCTAGTGTCTAGTVTCGPRTVTAHPRSRVSGVTLAESLSLSYSVLRRV